MGDWPGIDEPELAARLAMGDDEFAALIAGWAGMLEPRPFDAAVLDRALGYPWSRPARSYALVEGRVEPFDDLAAPRREALLEHFTADGPSGRAPLLAFGSNAAPDVLTAKFAHFAEADDRDVLVVSGRLHDFDVGAAAQPTAYGSMPATLFPSPGTAVRAGVLWVTPAQFTQLAWSEISYRLGRLRTRFEPDDTAHALDGVLAFVSRFGAFCMDGEPVAMAAIPAEGRTARALSQEGLLDAAAELALGPGARADALVRAIFEDFGAVGVRLAETVRAAGEPFASDRWTPYGTSPAVG